MNEINFKVQGMHCNSCEMIIKDELSEVKGVKNPEVDFKSGQGTLLLDTSQGSADAVLEAIKRVGYNATILNTVFMEKGKTHANGNGKASFQFLNKNQKGDTIRIVLEQQTVAEGKVCENTDGKLYFEGKVQNDRKTKFLLPENSAIDSTNYLEKLMKSVNFFSLFDNVKSEIRENNQESIVKDIPQDESAKKSISANP
ncbi:MAG: heavy metal-associated domain-containing protein, partial [Candidatus Levybacteria bacterium]|nr:heavy metal-associated domain-containing protein [Candidatus Levybacteria bacterium]